MLQLNAWISLAIVDTMDTERPQEEPQESLEMDTAPVTRVPRVFQERTVLGTLTDEQILRRFRLSRVAILDVYQSISQDLEPKTGRSHAIPGLVKLLSVLQHFGKHTFQTDTGSLVGISQPSVSRSLQRVLRAIRYVAREYIHFPKTPEAWRDVTIGFYQVAGMPKVLGAIDCTHVALRKPSGQEEAYKNRKHYSSLNVQMVCDSKQRIMSVKASNPGSFHDSRILQESQLYSRFENVEMPDGWLLGDKGYPCLPWLMTPLRNPQTAAEQNYNSAHCATRAIIERTFGVLKSRFLCLDKSGGYLLYHPLKAADVIMACCVLHNVALKHRVPTIGTDVVPPDDADMCPDLDVDPMDRGPLLRANLIDTHFSQATPTM